MIPPAGRPGRRRLSLLWRPAVADEVADELAFHLEMRARDYAAAGMAPSAAAAAARRRFGDVERVRSVCRAIARGRERAERRHRWLGESARDLRFAARRLAAAPGPTLVAVAALAVSLAAVAAAWRVARSVDPPLPFAAPAELAWVRTAGPGGADLAVTPAAYAAWRRQNHAFAGLAAWEATDINVGADLAPPPAPPAGTAATAGFPASPEAAAAMVPGAPPPMRVRAVRATASLLPLLGVRPALGRGFTVQEAARHGDHGVAVLSHSLWVARFAGDPAAVGGWVEMDGQPVRIIGVMPPGWEAPAGAQVWLPVQPRRLLAGNPRLHHRLAVVGRLRPGVTPAQAAAELAALSRRSGLGADPDGVGGDAAALTAGRVDAVGGGEGAAGGGVAGVRVARLADAWAGARWTLRARLLLAAAALLWLLGSAGAANVIWAAASARQRELDLRAALGGRGRVMRQLLAEGLLVALLGAACGLLAAGASAPWLGRLGRAAAGEPRASAGAPAGLASEGPAGVPVGLASAGQAGVPAGLASVGQAGAPGGLASAGQAGVPAGLASAGQAGAPAGQVSERQAGAPGGLASAGQAGAPAGQVSERQPGAPGGLASAGQTGVPVGLATAGRAGAPAGLVSEGPAAAPAGAVGEGRAAVPAWLARDEEPAARPARGGEAAAGEPGLGDLDAAPWLDPRGAGLLAALAVLSGLLCGLGPASQLRRPSLGEAVRQSARLTTRRERRLRDGLVVAEVALAATLLVAAGRLCESAVRLARADAGFTVDHVLTLGVALNGPRFPAAARRELVARLEDRLSQLPGVAAAGFISTAPLAADGLEEPYTLARHPGDPRWPPRRDPPALAGGGIGGGGEALAPEWRVMTPGAFAALGVRRRSGRFLTAGDRERRPLPVVVDETVVARWWPGLEPLGRRLLWPATGRELEVVGVAGALRDVDPEAAPRPAVFLPYAAVPWRSLALVVRPRAGAVAGRLAADVRREIAALAPSLPLPAERLLEVADARAGAGPRLGLWLVALYAAAALALAASGVYATAAAAVSRRTAEIAVRQVLGAGRGEVRRLVFRHGARLAVGGLTLGAAGAWLFGDLLRGLVYEPAPARAWSAVAIYAGAAVLLGGTVALASLLPARRAAGIAPALALRRE